MKRTTRTIMVFMVVLLTLFALAPTAGAEAVRLTAVLN